MTASAQQARPEHPVVTRIRQRRTEDVQLRIADAITRFAGSMAFVYLHVALFAGWMLLAEKNPWPTLTRPLPDRRTGRQLFSSMYRSGSLSRSGMPA
jgi:fatty acid desaturase